MLWLRLILIVGGLFNCGMGFIFIHPGSLRWFFLTAESIERHLFDREVLVAMPVEPVHLLLIHGFGAGVMILGAALFYSAKYPLRMLPFIFFDGLGRLLFSSILFYYVHTFSLMYTISLFGALEFALALGYIWGSWFLYRRVPE